MRFAGCIIVVMRQLGYVLLLAASSTGCSLIYNPSNLPPAPGDGAVDMPPIDADPTMLELTDVSPHELIEGAGAGNSRRAVLVLEGSNFVDTAMVTVTAHAGETLSPMITVDNAAVVVSSDTRLLAVPILVDVDPAIGPTAGVPSIRLDVSVTQPVPGDTITKNLTELAGGAAVLTITGLDELTGAASLSTAQPHKFSKVDATSISPSDTTKPLIVESTSSFVVSGAISVSATGAQKGPGGNGGGAGGVDLINGGDGSDGGGPGGGKHNGGGGGFGSSGQGGPGAGGGQSGDASLPKLGDPNISSGGAGGKGGLLGASGGNGGASGGLVMLTAAGDLDLGSVTANGGDGGAGAGGGTAGGGGSGGAIILRGATITVSGTISSIGGAGAAAPPSGAGAGGDGRIRFDAATKATTVSSTPDPGYRGPMLDVATPLIANTSTPMLTFNGSAGTFSYVVENADGSDSKAPVTLNMPSAGSITQASTPLFRGLNKICVRVANATTQDESKNCVTMVSLP